MTLFAVFSDRLYNSFRSLQPHIILFRYFCLLISPSQLGKREAPRSHIRTSISDINLNTIDPKIST